MVDIVSPEVRSRMMSGIRGTHTNPEMVLRRGLHGAGFRYRLHERKLPGKPDLVFPAYNAVLFAHGCFFHGHNCSLFKWPSTRPLFWREKITGNSLRDARNIEELLALGWRVGVVWECALKGRGKLPLGMVIKECARWLKADKRTLEVRGSV